MNRKGWFFLVFTIFFIMGCENSLTVNDASLQVSFVNKSSATLKNLTVADIYIGELKPENISGSFEYAEFSFDTGMPDEDASALIGDKLFTNYYRGYWCGTEKLTVESGKFLIEVDVIDTVLYLSCKNAPTIFDR